MKRLLFVLLAAVALACGAQVANARDHVGFAVTYSDGYYAPRYAYYDGPAYVATRPVYVERHYYGPRVIRARHICPPGYRFIPGHYSYRWHHWRPGFCRAW